MIEQPDIYALSLVLKFRHALGVTHGHAITAAAVTINALLNHLYRYDPESPLKNFYRQALEHLEKLFQMHQEKELKEIANNYTPPIQP